MLFALLMLTIATLALFVAFVSTLIWLAATMVVRLCDGKYIQAALWFCLLAWLVDAIWLR